MAKKVKGVKLGGKYGSAYQGSEVIMKAGTGQSGGVDIPRYNKKNFLMRLTPNSPGMIKASRGACVIDGVIRYPEGVEVDPARAAKAQALMDYNSAAGNSPRHREDMAEIYGEAYTREFERLKTAQNGPSAWRGGKRR